MGVFKRKTVKLAKSKSTFKKQFECERYFTIYCFNLIPVHNMPRELSIKLTIISMRSSQNERAQIWGLEHILFEILD